MRDVYRIAHEHPLHPNLYDSLGTLGTYRQTVDIHRRVVETHTVQRSIIYAVLLGVHYVLVLLFAVVESLGGICYPPRKAVEPLRQDLAVVAYGDTADLARWVL
jgi:hypothetical protein